MDTLELTQISTQIAEVLREQIFSGAIPRGIELRQETVARQLGVSRMPVRDAFHQLEMSGFLIKLPTRRVQVAGVSNLHLSQTLRMMCAMEDALLSMLMNLRGRVQLSPALLTALECAARDGDTAQCAHHAVAFHLALGESLGNTHCFAALNEMLRQYLRLVLHYAPVDFSSHNALIAALHSALAAGDAQNCKRHLKQYYDDLCRLYGEDC